MNNAGEQVEEWLELANGCLCCTVKYLGLESHHADTKPLLTPRRDTGVAAIESLMERRGAFDYILLETTGLADPGNLAPLFWVDEGLGSTIYLDGIVTLVDAKNILRNLSEPTPIEDTSSASDTSMLAEPAQKPHDHTSPHLSVANLQISHADVVVINKSDLVTATELEQVQATIRSINLLAKIHITQQSRVPALEGVLLDLHAYDNVDAEALEFASRGHSHLDPVRAFIHVTKQLH